MQGDPSGKPSLLSIAWFSSVSLLLVTKARRWAVERGTEGETTAKSVWGWGAGWESSVWMLGLVKNHRREEACGRRGECQTQTPSLPIIHPHYPPAHRKCHGAKSRREECPKFKKNKKINASPRVQIKFHFKCRRHKLITLVYY